MLSENAKWYVVHTYSGYENKVASNLQTIVENRSLQDVIQNIFIPTETVTEIKDNVKREVERKTFPGYVLIKMELNDQTWHIVRNTRGVTGFVGSGTHPEPLTDEEAASLGMDKRSVEVNYGLGDSVRITNGPLDGFIGTVTALDTENNQVTVTVSMFGRETPAELELGQVETIE
ncbi:MAG TPA: transcription termination/antitermination factor NusG [Ruminococcaceae bacterium]|nr:transcription termination/antitermination factor NusG [Oscillospiraceae bacterium]